MVISINFWSVLCLVLITLNLTEIRDDAMWMQLMPIAVMIVMEKIQNGWHNASYKAGYVRGIEEK